MRHDISASERLIVALDVDTKKEATEIVKALGGSVRFYKVGYQLYIASGMEVVRELTKHGKKVFLDLKLDDTPRTVERTIKNLEKDGIEFFTLQGNGDTAKAAQAGRGRRANPKFLQVTFLSSWDVNDLREHFHMDDGVPKFDLDDLVVNRASRILESGCEGVIASGTSIRKLRQTYPDILIVSPGIRPSGTPTDDHKRTLTPYEAIKAGADYLVVGRPIRASGNPKETAEQIQAEIKRALTENGGGGASPVISRKVSLTPVAAH